MPTAHPHAAPLYLYKGLTVHARFTPFKQRFQYQLSLLDIDIDRLDEAAKVSALFSIDKANLFSFRRRDHGARNDEPLRPWAEDIFQNAGIALDGGAIRLTTFARHLFYKFAPISLWFGYGPDGELRGIIYEVNNTFGDNHTYVASATSSASQPSRHASDKHMYVSPFFDVNGEYHFTLSMPENRLSLIIENRVNGERVHIASLKAERSDVTSLELLKTALSHPLQSHGVTLGIHWQALKLWLKGAGYRSRPTPANNPTSIAHHTEQKRV